MANYVVSSGETQSGIILNKADSMTVRNGGTASTTTVNSGGYLYSEGRFTQVDTGLSRSMQVVRMFTQNAPKTVCDSSLTAHAPDDRSGVLTHGHVRIRATT